MMSILRRNYFLIGLYLLAAKIFAFSTYSSPELDKLEKEFIQIINQANNIERSALTNQYLNHLGNQLAQAAHINPVYFFIVKSNEINAFAGPGNYIGINTQLILATNNQHELAGVIAHEIAHLRLHHLYSLIEHQKQLRIPMLASLLASIALGIINPTLGTGALMASLSGIAQENINFTRAKEKEADRIGMNILRSCNFDPQGIISFFQKLQQNSRYYYTDNVPAILRTHPLDEDRIAEAQNRLFNSPPQKYTTNLDYFLFKELIRVTTVNSKQLMEYYRYQCNKKQKFNAICNYSHALFLMKNNNFQAAQSKLTVLLRQDPNNLFYQLAVAQTELSNKQFASALARLEALYKNEPDNYAIIMAYASGLNLTNNSAAATNVLLKGFRIFKRDLPLCEKFAQYTARAHRQNYAYFIQAQCLILQGRIKEARTQLNYAKKLTHHDPYLQARINAMDNELNIHE